MTMERWVIIGFVVCIFAAVGMLGWHFTQPRRGDKICTSVASHCWDQPYAASP